MTAPNASLKLRYRVAPEHDAWVLSEELMPESRDHDLTAELLRELLRAWALRSGRNLQVGRNLAVRWDERNPKFGVDPDVYVVEPAPPEGDSVSSLRLWETGHFAPSLAIEVVSATSPRKDYERSPEKYAASGTRELWVFDPHLAGPGSMGGPFRIQVWSRDEQDEFVRIYEGDGPVRSPWLEAYLVAVDEGTRLRIARDAEGLDWWLTAEESERAAKESERAAKESERAAKEAALAANHAALMRIAQLEAELNKRASDK